ncbi:pre-mRNA cleavage factor Im 25 kDa subunit 2 [Histomonas meleagridis]|uniref:pre-mRNA cleavage factor Im 25 kDa subunit 2 n=1 Tax=Histomonas meleagridis TaxID=135588 RepID=UPI0035594384|nr:pre-mRNA cleavage factor Im 25 kDa subunit 2 [Histomonas meleagridis]KAH0802840.1 pre-mRNA cleavage factor Im 25 kDa subunit 2 [Histomonas meleagridis]
MAASAIIQIPDLDHFTFGTSSNEIEEQEHEKFTKIERIRSIFSAGGTVRSVRAIVLAHIHNHPHVLLLEKNSDNSKIIPGGILTPGEDDETGLQRLLSKKMNLIEGSYEISELIATWYRPQFTEHLFPYLPVHITIPKEVERWYLVLLPEKGFFGIPPKYKLHAVPFYDLQEGDQRIFGKQLPTIPLLVSRFNIEPI